MKINLQLSAVAIDKYSEQLLTASSTVEFGYNGFGYNVNSPITLHFSWSRQNSYPLCTFQFVYSGIAYNVNLAVTAPFFHPPDNFLCL